MSFQMICEIFRESVVIFLLLWYILFSKYIRSAILEVSMEVIYSTIKDVERLYKGLADESRLKILFLLDDLDEACVRDIQQVLRVPQPTVSRHLGLLKRMGLVDNRRRGKWNYYYVVKKQPDMVKYLMNGFINVDSVKRIFRKEMQSQMDKLLPRPKFRR